MRMEEEDGRPEKRLRPFSLSASMEDGGLMLEATRNMDMKTARDMEDARMKAVAETVAEEFRLVLANGANVPVRFLSSGFDVDLFAKAEMNGGTVALTLEYLLEEPPHWRSHGKTPSADQMALEADGALRRIHPALTLEGGDRVGEASLRSYRIHGRECWVLRLALPTLIEDQDAP